MTRATTGRTGLGQRRRIGHGHAKVGVLILLLLSLALPAQARAVNAVQAENALPGDSYWSAALQDPLASPPIDGYASATSVRPGDTISFQVSTNPLARYRIEISRLGWYGGNGGRRITCLVRSQFDPSCTMDRAGVQQPGAPPPDPATGEIRAGWSPTDTLVVPSTWVSGYYVAVFRLTSGPSAGETGFTPFIVQAPGGDHAAILVQVPTNTWQAYNPWGGLSFYTKPVRAVKVSFDRPYAHRLLFNWEYPLIRFLERAGWDVSYATDDDVDADPAILRDHTLDLSAGHDEYWTKVMRDGWEAASAAGVNLAFMGANDGFWQVRYEDGRRTLVGYKYYPDPYPDPAERTTQFRALDPPRPECELLGIQFQGDVISRQNWDLVADPAVANDSWFAGTGLTPGAVLAGLGGMETDSVVPGCHVPPVTRLLSYAGPPQPDGTPSAQDTVRYTACSGAEVFSAGSLQFAWGLDSWRDPSYVGPGLPPLPPANGGLEQAMTNALSDLTRSHVPTPGPPEVCVPSAGIATPVAWAAAGQPVTFQSTATDAYGEISAQQWQLSLNGSSADATGAQVTHTFSLAGAARVGLTVTDSSGASAQTERRLEVCPCQTTNWSLAAEQGPPCEVMAIGAIRRTTTGLSLAPFRVGAPIAVTTSRITERSGRIRLRWARDPSPVTGAATSALPAVRAPIVVELAATIQGRVRRQLMLIASAPSHGVARPQPLTESLCDGTSAEILTPAFRGPRRLPLRLSVRVHGPGIVSLFAPDGREIAHRRVTGNRRLSFASARLPRGVYRVLVAPRRARLGQPVRLAALAV